MKDISSLKHVERSLPGGGLILVLNTGALIGPEAEAMLQALHSRSTGGVKEHLEVLKKRGPEKFMETFYVGYGHKSIGDCGTATIFIEGVSMLVAKAVQDWPLYSGQEASTRFIDFSKQPFLNPANILGGEEILKALRRLYLHALDEIVPVLVTRHPKQDGEDEKKYEKAIKARGFDIARSLLPAGAFTNLAWHTNLRQAADKLSWIKFHPLAEVREVALAVEDALREAFPSSFGGKTHPESEEYCRAMMDEYYLDVKYCPDFTVTHDNIDRKLLEKYRKALERRPNRHTELPKHISECGTMRFEFMLDFGSFRDIQRQRAVTQRMPLVTTRHGFEPWYLEQMSDVLRGAVKAVLNESENNTEFLLKSLRIDPSVAQYYVPMGYRLPNHLTGNLHALVYLAELRAASVVHPTLQIRAHQIARELRERFGPYGLVLYTDEAVGRFDVKRGGHDIVKKEE